MSEIQYKDVAGRDIAVGDVVAVIQNKELTFARVTRLGTSGSKYEGQRPTVYGKRVFRKTKQVTVREKWGVKLEQQVVWVTDGTQAPLKDHSTQMLVVETDQVPPEALQELYK